MGEFSEFVCDLDNLGQRNWPFSAGFLEYCREAAVFALNENQHNSGVCLSINGDRTCKFKVTWSLPITDQIKNTFNDNDYAIEFGAYLLSFFQVDNLSEYKVQKTAKKGGGFDYWLSCKNDSLNMAARLEVSGLLHATNSQYNDRIRVKSKQISKSDQTGLPGYISVTNFGRPESNFQWIVP